MADRYTYRGLPARGISLFAAHGEVGERAVLGSRMATYKGYYRLAPGAACESGILLPTFTAPHWTLLIEPSESDSPRPLSDLLDELIAILGPLLENPKFVKPDAGRR